MSFSRVGFRHVRARLLTLGIAMSVLLTLVVMVSPAGSASSHDVTGSAVESAVTVNEIFFAAPVQHVWNDASGGTFTLTYLNQTTGPLDWNASAGQIETALESLSNVTAVTVTGLGDIGNPWVVTFETPAVPRAGLIATDSLTDGSSTVHASPGNPLPIDPSGIVYLGDNLLIADSEINEELSVYDGVNLWEMTTSASVVETGTTLAWSDEPTGLAYNSENTHLFVSDDEAVGIWEVAPDGLGNYGSGLETVVGFLATAPIGLGDPEDVAWDLTTGQLFIAGGLGASGSANHVVPVYLGADGKIGGGDDVPGSVLDFSHLVGDLEGITYRAETDTLLLTDVSGQEKIVEVTKDGRLIRIIDITFIHTPSDLVIAPASEGTGDSLYVVDKWRDNNDVHENQTPPQDGRLFELSVPFNNLKPFVNAGPDKTITIGDPLTLTGDSYDDDQTATLTTMWAKVIGPGTVSFGNVSALSTTASFSAAGTYTLRLTANDGSLSNTDDVVVQVHAQNQAPTVSAGPNQTITLPNNANLSGSASDDGLPKPPGSLTTTWSKVSGPGTVSFGNALATSTSASFSTHGTYTLRLTANDGSLQSSDTVTITVNSQPAVDPGVDTFIDDDDSIFEADIEWMAAEGITKGCNPPLNDRFCPDDFVTRGQMAAFLVRALGYTDGLGADLFIDDDGITFENDIDRLGTAGVTKGCNPPTNDRYCPNDFVTRGQMAAFLVRALGYTDGLGADLFIDDDGSTFENDIDRLGTAGVTRGCNPPVNDRFCPGDFVTRGQMAAFLHRALG